MEWNTFERFELIAYTWINAGYYIICLRIGCYELIILDQGREFVNKVKEELFHLLDYLLGPHHPGTKHETGGQCILHQRQY